MPGKIGVKIKAGRNLPVMDRGSDTTDAYVEIKLGNTTYKTEVYRKSLNPQWNTDWFRFEVDDSELQDEPLQIRLMDYDTYSANDAIGKVNISLNPLCLETSGQTTHGKGTVLSGWIPVFDTMHGIRGEVNVIVKVDLFSDVNKFRQSSCGIPFFHSQCIPHGYRAQVIHGFVEELVVNDDPEYQWIDKIRTPRASNEARQVVFLKLSGQVQRKMGLKAINMGANAVIGYTQCFDLEGDVGVVARGIGTAVTLIKDANIPPLAADNALIEERVLNYLDFLTGNHSKSGPRNRGSDGSRRAGACLLYDKPGYELQIQKSRSTTLFELKKLPAGKHEPEIMLDLMRQEDERGERPPKKFKQHMKRFTRSSRNIFNETYTAFMQKMSDSADSKSSRSLTSLLTTTGSIKEESGSSTRSSTLDVRRLSRKELKKLTPTKPLGQRGSFKKSAHPIHRSISDNTAMQKHLQNTIAVASGGGATAVNTNVHDEYQDSTRSSPNICTEEQNAHLQKVQAQAIVERGLSDSGHQLFGQFSDHTTHLLGGQEHVKIFMQSSSSTTLSMSLSGSSDEEDDDDDDDEEDGKCIEDPDKRSSNDYAEYDNDDLKKIERLMKNCNCNEEEEMAQQWIQPGQSDSNDGCIDDALPKHSLLADLKNFSQNVQDFLKRSAKKPLPSYNKQSLSLKYFNRGERKSYYSSQPELCSGAIAEAIARTTLLAAPSCTAAADALMQRSRSLNNLTNLGNNSNKNNNNNDNVVPAPPRVDKQLSPPVYPILQICPSTPTPDSEYKKFTKIVDAPEHSNSLLEPPTPPPPQPQSSTNSRVNETSFELGDHHNQKCSLDSIPCNIRKARYKKAKTFTNQHSTLLVAPFLSPTLPCKSSSQIIVSKRRRHQHHPPPHHRSLTEISSNATATAGAVAGTVSASAITDSPCMKRNVSPALAAIVAAGSGSTNATQPPNAAVPNGSATTSLSGSCTKLTASPAKSAANNPSQSDSLSSTTTTASTATTTVLAKEVGEMCRRSSDSDLSITPKGNSLCVASERLVAATAMMRLNQPIGGKSGNNDGIDMLEYPFLTMTKYPAGFILHLGATVAARSVKLLERVPNPDEPEVRDSWWTELRMEIRSHARALGCNVVLGYSESTTISDDVCVLSATGTASVINMAYNRSVSQTDIITMTKASLGGSGGMSSSLEERDMLKETTRNANGTVVALETVPSAVKENLMTSSLGGVGTGSQQQGGVVLPNAPVKKFGTFLKNSCSMCHVPYNLPSVPFNTKMKKCSICRKGRVPDVLLATLEVPEHLAVTGRGCFMQAQVVRAKKDLRSELNAKEISDGLPFLEYELHRVLINKLKAKGMNAIFGLKAQVSIGERMIALIATGTALFLSALPVPQVPKIVAGNSWTDKQKLNEIQKKLQETFERNQEIYQLKCIDPDGAGGAPTVSSTIGDKQQPQQQQQSDTDESDDDVMEMDLNCGNKDTCVLEVDDIEDLEIISLLMEPYPPEGFHVVNTQMVPGMVDMEAVKNLQMFTQVWRAKLDVGQNISSFPKHFQRLLQTIYFKLRTMIPCAICDLRFRLDLPESDQIQLLVTGMALGLADANKFKYRRKHVSGGGGSISLNGDIQNTTTNGNQTQPSDSPPIIASLSNKRTLQDDDYIFPLDEDQMVETPTPTTNVPQYGSHSFKLRKTSPSRSSSKASSTSVVRNRYFPLRDRYGVDITPLSFIPGGRIEKYLGNLNFFFIRESTSIRENGGISGFVHGFITELLAVVRAHISALGGNAMVSFYMTELILFDNQHKNQGQCLISIGGDAVFVYYNGD